MCSTAWLNPDWNLTCAPVAEAPELSIFNDVREKINKSPHLRRVQWAVCLSAGRPAAALPLSLSVGGDTVSIQCIRMSKRQKRNDPGGEAPLSHFLIAADCICCVQGKVGVCVCVCVCVCVRGVWFCWSGRGVASRSLSQEVLLLLSRMTELPSLAHFTVTDWFPDPSSRPPSLTFYFLLLAHKQVIYFCPDRLNIVVLMSLHKTFKFF